MGDQSLGLTIGSMPGDKRITYQDIRGCLHRITTTSAER